MLFVFDRNSKVRRLLLLTGMLAILFFSCEEDKDRRPPQLMQEKEQHIQSPTVFDYYVLSCRGARWGAARVVELNDSAVRLKVLCSPAVYKVWRDGGIGLVNDMDAYYKEDAYQYGWVNKTSLIALAGGQEVSDTTMKRLGINNCMLDEIRTLRFTPRLAVKSGLRSQSNKSVHCYLVATSVDVEVIGIKDLLDNVQFNREPPFLVSYDKTVEFHVLGYRPPHSAYDYHLELTCRYRTDSIFTYVLKRE